VTVPFDGLFFCAGARERSPHGGRLMLNRISFALVLVLLASCGSAEQQDTAHPIPSEDMMILVGHVYCHPVLRQWCETTRPCEVSSFPGNLATILGSDGSVMLVTPGGNPFHFQRGAFKLLDGTFQDGNTERGVYQWILAEQGEYLLAADPCAARVYIVHFPLPPEKTSQEGAASPLGGSEDSSDVPLPAEWVPGTLECFDPARE